MELFSRKFNENIERQVLKDIFYDAIMISDINGIIRYIKKYDDDMSPFDVKSAVGKHILEIYTDIKPENSTMLHAIKGIPTLGRQTTQTAFNGRTCIFYEHTIPLKANGKIIGAVSVAKFIATFTKEVTVTPSMLSQEKVLYSISDIIGNSPATEYLKAQIKQVSATSSSVLITGETGSGKELVAQAVHSEGPRRNKPFVSQNCSAIPITLLESILFGTVKGSFTGAEDKAGLFEIANGGTLFLDEINSMDINMQAKILKVIEEKRVKRLGSAKEIPVDVRVVSAMNEEPQTCIEQNRLRSDLFYRIAVVQIKVPPLRERKTDIPVLAQHYIDFYNYEMKKNIRGLSSQVEKLFREYKWPGNVRELRNIIEGAFNFRNEGEIALSDLTGHVITSAYENSSLENSADTAIFSREYTGGFNLTQTVEIYEKNLILEAAAEIKTLNRLAEYLGISRQALSYKLRKYNIKL